MKQGGTKPRFWNLELDQTNKQDLESDELVGLVDDVSIWLDKVELRTIQIPSALVKHDGQVKIPIVGKWENCPLGALGKPSRTEIHREVEE